MDDRLLDLLVRARDVGLLGPGPVEDHLAHARAWAEVLADPPEHGLDLGSGAGVPGLVLAATWPGSRWTLLDAAQRRGEWLRAAVDELGFGGRVTVVVSRAETAARTELREQCDLVVARGFGAPAVTAECATGFLPVGGRLSVSEPPPEEGSPVAAARWPAEPLALLGFDPPRFVRRDAGFVILRKATRTDTRWPRRDGVPHRRPLW